MGSLPASSDRPEAALFADGLGDRVVAPDTATGELLQIFRLRPVLTAVPSFEFALRERTARLANFRHAYFARVRRVDRSLTPSSLAIVSDHIEGIRLAEILRVARDKHLQLDINAALCLIRQLVPAVALLHENARDVAHGLIAPERILVSPHSRLVIVEHVLGSAVEQLQFGRERLWREFRIAMPPSAGVSRFDHRSDVNGIGLVALALVLGRPIELDEFPQQIPMLLERARERSSLGEEQPLSPALRGWLSRALQLDVRRAFASAPEAMAALDEVVADDSGYVAAPIALETFLSRYISALVEEDTPAAPQPVAAARPAAPAPASAAPTPAPIASTPAPIAPPVADLAPRPIQDSVRPVPQPMPTGHDPLIPRDLSDMLDVSDLAPPIASMTPSKPLFNPDAPFNATRPSTKSAKPAGSGWRGSRRLVAIAALLLTLVGGGAFVYRFYWPGGSALAMGSLSVQTNPAGVQVFVDGVDRGLTPTRLTLAPGAHILELRGRGTPRVIPLTVSAGAEVSQYFELAEAPATGQLAIQSDTIGAKVIVDGTERGVTPITIADLAPGEHEVIVQTEAATVRHMVTVQVGAIASLVAPLAGAAPAGPVSGWVSVKAPFTVEIREQGRLLGTTDTDRVMVTAGRHELELVNDALGLRVTKVVQVPPGKVAPVTLDLPRGAVNLNAVPWAEVWINGERVGETPIGNLSLPIGPHEVVFRHPQMGEKRHAISVTTTTPVRLSVQMQ